MKHYFSLAALAFICILAASCTKEHVKVPTSNTDIPDELVGKWQVGNFNIKNFPSYNGTRPANVTNTIAYNIGKDGQAEQYIYFDNNDGSDLQTCTYRKGTITLEAGGKTWKFCPASGTFKKFQKGTKTDGNINQDGLYPKYAPYYTNFYVEKYGQDTYMGASNEYGEDVAFRKTTW